MALALDASADADSVPFSVSVTISTTTTNCLLLLFVNNNGGVPGTPSDVAGLTWTRFASVNAGDHDQWLELWWAVAAAVLTGDVITVTQPNSATIGATVLAVSGADTSSPFDGAGGSTASVGVAMSITTTVADTFITASYRNFLDTMTAGAGFTGISSSGFSMTEY